MFIIQIINNMPGTIEGFIQKYELDNKISSYDNDTKQIIADILTGNIDDYANSENYIVLLSYGDRKC